MSTCQYFGQTNCTAPTFGSGSTTAASSGPHENFIERYLLLGTSPLDWLLNGILWLFVIRFIIWPFLIVPILDYLDSRRLSKIKNVCLEFTPPSTSAKTAHATNELFGVVYGMYSIRSFTDKLLRRKQTSSFEVVSTREQGIRYIVRLPEEQRDVFEQIVTSYLPGIQFKIVDDYLLTNEDNGSHSALLEFKQARHFAYPLKTHDTLSQHDPIAFITGSLSKPKPGELLALQIVLSPARPKAASRLRSNLIAGKQPDMWELSWKLPFVLAIRAVGTALHIFGEIVTTVATLITPVYEMPVRFEKNAVQQTTKASQEIDDKVLGKLGQSLFYATIRAYIVTNDEQQLSKRATGLITSLTSFHDPGFQGLVTKQPLPLLGQWDKYQTYQFDNFIHRAPSAFTYTSCLLSSEEVAGLYHFPYGQDAQAENIAKSFSKTLAAPIAMKQHADTESFDVVLGTNHHHGSDTPIGLTADERQRHVYVIGGTGNGKTTLLKYAMIQDIQNGKGVALIDPHGDLAEELLRHIPEERMDDVIYFNPRDISHPIGLNLLELPEGLSEDDLLLEKDFITESVVSIFRKIFSDEDSGGHRIEHFLRNTIHTAFTVPDATLFTVYKLLTNAKFRRIVTKKLTDGDLIDFWAGEFNTAGDYQKVKMSSGVNAKLGRFSRSAVSRRILEQPKSTIDFDDIIQNNKILICNFSKGHIGEDTSGLLGISVLAKLQLAALRRSRLGQAERTPFYLYVDEFQNFATISFVQLLSEARKYKLFLTMAEQSTAQQDERRLVDIILANVGTVVCFRSGSPADEAYLLPLFRPYIDEGEIANLPAFNFYAKVSAIKAQEPISGETILLDSDGDEAIADAVTALSRENYAKEYVSPEAELNPEPKQGVKRDTKSEHEHTPKKINAAGVMIDTT